MEWIKPELAKNICTELSGTIVTNDQGMTSFKGGDFSANTLLLEHNLKHNLKVPDGMLGDFLYSALFKATPLEPNSLLKAVQAEAKKYGARKLSKFVLCGDLVAPKALPRQRVVFDGATISFPKSLLPKERAQMARSLENIEWLAEPNTAAIPFRVFVDAKSAFEAGEKAIEKLNLFRGIWNLVVNYPITSRYESGLQESHRPINSIRLGPVQILKGKNAKSFEERYWYEPNFTTRGVNPEPKLKPKKLKSYETFARKQMLKAKTSKHIELAFIRYSQCLDLSDAHGSFLGLWGLLEHLTFTEDGRNETTIRRTSFIFSDHSKARELLYVLSRARNNYVHSAKGTHEIQKLQYICLLYTSDAADE